MAKDAIDNAGALAEGSFKTYSVEYIFYNFNKIALERIAEKRYKNSLISGIAIEKWNLEANLKAKFYILAQMIQLYCFSSYSHRQCSCHPHFGVTLLQMEM